MRRLALAISLAVLVVCAAGLWRPDEATRSHALAPALRLPATEPTINGARAAGPAQQVQLEFQFLELRPELDDELVAATSDPGGACRLLSSEVVKDWIDGALAQRRMVRLAHPCLVIAPGVEGSLFSGGEFRSDEDSARGRAAGPPLRFGTQLQVRASDLRDGVHLEIVAAQSCRVFREHSAVAAPLVKGCRCAGAVDLPWNQSAVFDMAPDATLQTDAESAHPARRTVLVVRAAAVR